MFDFQSWSEENVCLPMSVRRIFIYTSMVRRGCVQGPDTKCTDRRQTDATL